MLTLVYDQPTIMRIGFVALTNLQTLGARSCRTFSRWCFRATRVHARHCIPKSASCLTVEKSLSQDTMAVSEACCNLPPVTYDYTPQGSSCTVVHMDVYVTGPANSHICIIAIPDIFGLSNQVKQVCDLVASGTGFRVVLPDLLRGSSWPLHDMPPKDPAAFKQFLSETCAWANNEIAYTSVADWVKSQGAVFIGTLGFCWGAHIALQAARSGTVFAAAGVHYSLVTPELLEQVQCPVALLPSKQEPPEGELVAVLKSTPHGDKCLVKRFDDMHHGWCAARGDYVDPLQARRATEAVQLLVQFFSTIAPPRAQ